MAAKHAKDKEREFLAECIELYRKLPALWQVKSKVYRDRDKKNSAYKILLSKYNELFPQATKEDLKKKINSLRTNYRKELKKCISSVKSGDAIYVPTLWYFEHLNFLRDEELQLDFESSIDNNTNSTADEDENNAGKITKRRASTSNNQASTLTETQPRSTFEQAPKKPKRDGEHTDLAYERVSEIKDEYRHWGLACAADLQKMEHTQQLYVKKAIAEIMMEGQLGLLHRHSVKINEYNTFNSPVATTKYSDPMSPPPSYSIPLPSFNNQSPSPLYYDITNPSSIKVEPGNDELA